MIGNLNEAGATLILLSVFRYYGFDLERLFGKHPSQLRGESQLRDGQH